MNAESAEVVVGGGLEGCATAWALTQRGVTDVVLVERATVGSGGTGKSSGVVRCHDGVSSLAAMATRSLETFEHAHDVLGAEFAASGVAAAVPPGRSILTVAEEAGIPTLWSCREGTCGTCGTPLLAGRAEHRDTLLTAEEQQAQDTLMICVSRAVRGCARLRLDL